MKNIDLKWGNFYIAKLSYFKGNPIHEAIIYVCSDKKGYETISVFQRTECEEVRISELNYFEVVSKIDIKN